MTASSITVRAAAPSIEEGMAFARYLNVSADGAFRALLGKKYDTVLGEAYLSPDHDLSHDKVVFAEWEGHIAGMAAGYTSTQHEQSSDEPLRQAAGFRAARMAVFSVLGRGMKGFLKTVPHGDFYLQAVAVDADHRGSGIGTELLDFCEEKATAAGSRRIVLDVSQKNAGARQLYERRGMRLDATSPSILLLPNSRALRMVKDL